MKLLICGKGGCGKSTLAVLLARAFTDKGRRVLLVDADESNLELHRLAGTDNARTLLEFLGGKAAVRQARSGGLAPPGPCGPFYQAPFSPEDIPAGCCAAAEGVRLLKVGKIERYEEGCACPMGGMLRQFLSHLRLGPDEVALIDTAAGLEHFGRGIERHCDRILGVIDPTFASFKLAKAMDRIAADAGLDIAFVLNKTDARVKAAMGDYLAADRIIGEIPMSDGVFSASLEGRPIEHRLPEVRFLADRLEAEARDRVDHVENP